MISLVVPVGEMSETMGVEATACEKADPPLAMRFATNAPVETDDCTEAARVDVGMGPETFDDRSDL